MRCPCFFRHLAALAPLVAFLPAFAVDRQSWPQWRGSSQNGVATGEEYPIRWSEESGIAWKIELPGRGSSTPVVQTSGVNTSGVDRSTAYLTAGVEGKNMLLAIDTETGKIKWQTELGDDRGEKHRKGSGSNPSPVIDGDSIFAYFRSGDLGCVDSSGELKWKINLQEKYGEDSLWWDLGSSPLLTDNGIIIAVMQSGPSYVAAFDKQTGNEIWKVDRMLDAPDEAAQSYTTPLAVQVGDHPAIAVMGAERWNRAREARGFQSNRP